MAQNGQSPHSLFKIDFVTLMNVGNGQIILSETVWTKLYIKLDQRKFVKSLRFKTPS